MGAEADEDGVEGSQAKDEAGEEDGDSANIKEEEAE